jgi:hypothetical protein
MFSIIILSLMKHGDTKIDVQLNSQHLDLLHLVENKSFIINVEEP